jgi:hypothetical protein
MTKRRPKIRDYLILIALAALQSSGIAWLAWRPGRGPVVRSADWSGIAEDLAMAAILFGPFIILTGIIVLYVPPKLDEVAWTILVLVYLVWLLLPVVQS